MPVATTPVIDVLIESERSTSLTLSVPLAVSPALVSVSVALALSLVTRWISGSSLVPVMVMVTSWVSTPPRPSLTCTLNTSS
ncbi:hypothetical protein D3C75_1313600 [compost metagenome]